jgi:hypothetical protein
MRRFLLHVLPGGFHRIRHYGLLANGSRKVNLACDRGARRGFLPRGLCDTCPQVIAMFDALGSLAGQASHNP